MTGNNSKLDLVNVDAHKKIVRFCQFVLRVLGGGGGNLTSIKGQKFAKNDREQSQA